MSEPIPREAQAYYDRGVEAGRLFRSHGLIELDRTQEIILRHLPPPPPPSAATHHCCPAWRKTCWAIPISPRSWPKTSAMASTETRLNKDYFTTTFFHRPDELRGEVIEAGFDLVELLGVEGPGGLLPDIERRWSDPEERERLLQAARVVEREPSLLGLHPHLLAVARRPASEAG